MFERYTEKARRVLFFARYEAAQFGAATIEGEHILLGLFREDKELIKRFFVPSEQSIETLRKEIEVRSVVGQRVSTSVDLPFSEGTQLLFAYAFEESEALNQRHIGTEHLLLALLRNKIGVSAEVLQLRGLTIESVRESLKKIPIDPNKPKERKPKEIYYNIPKDLPDMIAQTRLFANATLALCNKMEAKYKELQAKLSEQNAESASNNEECFQPEPDDADIN